MVKEKKEGQSSTWVVEKECVIKHKEHNFTANNFFRHLTLNFYFLGTSLVVQWLRLHSPSAGGPGSIPGQGTRSHMPQLRGYVLQPKILHTATKTRCSQINK